MVLRHFLLMAEKFGKYSHANKQKNHFPPESGGVNIIAFLRLAISTWRVDVKVHKKDWLKFIFLTIYISPEIRVQFRTESYQRLKKWYLMSPCLTLSIIRYWSRAKWSNPGVGVVSSHTHHSTGKLYIYIYIFSSLVGITFLAKFCCQVVREVKNWRFLTA